MINSCLFCDKQFETVDENMLFCSKKCKQGFKGNEEINENTDICEEFELMEEEND